MSHLAERLILLSDQSLGLLNRAHLLYYHQKPDVIVQQPDIDKIGKLLCKNFPRTPSEQELNQQKVAYPLFQSKSQELETVLQPYYQTLVHTSDVLQLIWQLLIDCSSLYHSLSIDLHPDICGYVLNLVQRYVQLHLLYSKIDVHKSLQYYASLYVKAYQFNHRQDPERQQDVINFVNKFVPSSSSTNPSYHIVQLLQSYSGAIALFIGDLITTFHNTLHRYNIQQLRATVIQQRPFNLIDTHAHTLQQVTTINAQSSGNEKLAYDLLHYDKLKQHLIYAYMLCPSELSRPNYTYHQTVPDGITVLLQCLRDEMLLTVHRDVVVDSYTLYETVFNNYKATSITSSKPTASSSKFKLSKHSKSVSELQIQWDVTVQQHLEFQAYLCVESQSLLQFIELASNTITITKLQPIYILLHLIRNELLWYYRYINTRHPTKQKYMAINNADVSHVTQLLHNYTTIVNVIRFNKHNISTYYKQWVETIDLLLVEEALHPVHPLLPQESVTLLKHMLQQIRGQQSVSDNVSYEALRLHYYRFSSTVLLKHYAAIDQQAVNKLLHTVNLMVQHTRYIDTLDTLMKNYTSLYQLYWYKNEVYNTFKRLLELATPNTGGASSGVMSPTNNTLSPTNAGSSGASNPSTSDLTILSSALAYLRVYHDAPQNIHRLAPEELASIGSECKSLTDISIKRCIQCIEALVKTQITDYNQLTHQLHPTHVLQRMLPTTSTTNNSYTVLSQHQPPGSESFEYSSKTNQHIRHFLDNQHKLQALLQSFVTTDTITIYNIQFSTREYWIDSCSKHLRREFRSVWLQTRQQKDSNDNSQLTDLSPFTNVYKQWTDICRTYLQLNNSINIDMQQIITDTVLSECTAHTDNDNNNANDLPVIHTITAHIARLFSASDAAVRYNPDRQCFTAARVPTAAQQQSPSIAGTTIEQLTDSTALQSLVQLVGLNGVKHIDDQLLVIVKRCVGDVKKIAGVNSNLIQSLQQQPLQLADLSVIRLSLDRLQNTDALLDLLKQIGNIVQFRVLLFSAVSRVLNIDAKDLHSALNIASIALHSDVNASLAHAGITDLLQSDPSLYDILTSHKQSTADAVLFSTLPELFAFALLSSRLRHSAQPHSAASNTTAQAATITTAVIGIVRGFHRCNDITHLRSPKAGAQQSSEDSDAVVRDDLCRFARLAANAILYAENSNQGNANSNNSNAQQPTFNTTALLSWLQSSVPLLQPYISSSVVEQSLPYALCTYNTFVQQVDNSIASSNQIAGT